jgi:broad specificity phosphatase PhoE
MKYVKTFENFSKEETTEDIKKLQDPNSPEFKDLVAKLAKEKGADVQQAVVQAVEAVEDAKSTEKTTNEELLPMALLAIPVVAVAGGVLVGLISAKIAAKRGLKIYIEQEARTKVAQMVKENPELANNVEELVSKAYDEMMADEEFISKIKSEEGQRLVSMGSVKAGRGPY